jgi:hypothetical protein
MRVLRTHKSLLALALGLDALDLIARANISQRYLEDRELTLPMSAIVDLLSMASRNPRARVMSIESIKW